VAKVCRATQASSGPAADGTRHMKAPPHFLIHSQEYDICR